VFSARLPLRCALDILQGLAMSSNSLPTSQTDRVVLTMREMLLRGAFNPGERLTELSLVSRLGASRTPVRHALARLAHEGLLEPQPSGGFRVRAFTLQDVWDAIELRGVVEGTAARLAAERLTDPGELAAIQAAVEGMDQLTPVNRENFSAYLELNVTFHSELRRLSKSPMLMAVLDKVIQLPFADPGALVFSEAESEEANRASLVAQEHHRSILDAIMTRAGTRAESLAREHALVARRNLERALRSPETFERIPGASLVQLPTAM
jgi:GntR family transcriptional regulator of vanillate catabolism